MSNKDYKDYKDDVKFLKSIEIILKHEGGYVNNPSDPGGETKYGISKRAYPNLDIKELTVEEAKEIYYKDYWVMNNLDKIPFPLCTLVLDFAVNSGSTRAAKYLQEILGFTGNDVDGIIGPMTLSKFNDISPEELKEITLKYLLARFTFLTEYLMSNKSAIVFIKGLAHRALSLVNFVKQTTPYFLRIG